MLNKSVFFTVVYPKALPFFCDICLCVRNQNNSGFEFLIVNDGCEIDSLEKYLQGITHTIIDALGSPSKNRQQGINYARNAGYQYILFCDADDTFEPDRFNRTLQEFEYSNADIVVTNLNVVDENLSPIINDYFQIEIPDECWIDESFIVDKNIFGMSNTALRLDALKKNIVLPETPIADWFLFTMLLNNGLKAKYIKNSLINYRQYNNNLIGINRFDVESFKRLAELKKNHYKVLVEWGYLNYKKRLTQSEDLLLLSDDEIEELIKSQLAIHKQPLWWQIVSKL